MSVLQTWLQSLDYSYEILPNCTKFISPHSSCNVCISVCPDSAIHLDGNKPVLDVTKCSQCTKCLVQCPVQAIAGILPARDVKKQNLFLKNSHPLSAKELLIYYQKEIRTIVIEDDREAFLPVIDEANKILFSMDLDPFILLDNYIVEEEKYTKKDLFKYFKDESKKLAKEVTPAKWRFNQNHLNLNQYFPTYMTHSISIDIEKCILCKACIQLCPDKCFQLTENSFHISPQKCQGCKLCEDICIEKAIKITAELSVHTTQNIKVYKLKCDRCKKAFESTAEESTTCFVCNKLKQMGNSFL